MKSSLHSFQGISTTPYAVKLEIFEGPLDLLLYLIKQEEVNIQDVSLERITCQYLEYLQVFQQLDIELAGEFIVMAAHLLYLKSLTLLPASLQEDSDEPLGEEEGPQWELIHQLIEYKKFKEAALWFRDQEGLQSHRFTRPERAFEMNIQTESVLQKNTVLDLVNAFQQVVARRQSQAAHEIFEEIFTVSNKMEVFLQLKAEKQRFCFEESCGSDPSYHELAVALLAALELIRMQQLVVLQEQLFDVIWFEARENGSERRQE